MDQIGLSVNEGIEEVFETIEDCEKGITSREELIKNNQRNLPLVFICAQQIDELKKYKESLLQKKTEQ